MVKLILNNGSGINGTTFFEYPLAFPHTYRPNGGSGKCLDAEVVECLHLIIKYE